MTNRRSLTFLCGRTSEGAAALFLNGTAKSFSYKVGGTHTGGTASFSKTLLLYAFLLTAAKSLKSEWSYVSNVRFVLTL